MSRQYPCKKTLIKKKNGFSNHKSTTGNVLSELEKQLSEKNAIIDFLTSQLITAKPLDATKNINSSRKYHHEITDEITESNHNEKINSAPLEKINDDKTRKKVNIIGDSMLNNINSRGLSKFKKAEVLNYPGATSSDIIDKIDDVLDAKS